MNTKKQSEIKSGLSAKQWFLLLIAFFMGVAATITIKHTFLSDELPSRNIRASSTDR